MTTQRLPDELKTVGDIAHYCRCRPETVRRWIAKGLLPAVNLPGGEYRINADDLDRVLTTVEARR